ncbi:hypothetical protein N9X12_07505 [Alphaproteobacteria bacterium]|nr:hypothetical protein [Alphaproteobacteria bacterium]
MRRDIGVKNVSRETFCHAVDITLSIWSSCISYTLVKSRSKMFHVKHFADFGG